MLLTTASEFLNSSSTIAEKFNNNGNNNNNNNNGNNGNNNNGNKSGRMIVILIILVIWIALVLLIGKYLWNECLCKVISVCKPIDSVFTIIGLVVLFDILKPQLNSNYNNYSRR
jgi:hypothetical protein